MSLNLGALTRRPWRSEVFCFLVQLPKPDCTEDGESGHPV